MVVDMINLLAISVINNYPEMVDYLQFLGDHFGVFVKHIEYFQWSLVEVLRYDFGDYQQMHRRPGIMIGDNDDFIVFKEYLGR